MQTTDLIVLNYDDGSVDFYSFDFKMNSDEIEDFLFNRKNYKESEIHWMFAPKIVINNYGNNY